MDSPEPRFSPSEFVELQRECHPFPVYIDYLLGWSAEDPEDQKEQPPLPSPHLNTRMPSPRPEFSRAGGPIPFVCPPKSAPNNNGASSIFGDPNYAQLQPLLANQSVGPPRVALPDRVGPSGAVLPNPFVRQPQSNATNPFVGPARSNSTGPSHIGFFAMSPAPSSVASTNAFPPQVRPPLILQRNNIMHTMFNWIPEDKRVTINAKVGQLRDVSENENVPANARAVARHELVRLSTLVSNEHMKKVHHGIHSRMPMIYDLTKVRVLQPNTQAAADAEKNLRSLQNRAGIYWDYVKFLLGQMEQKRATGQSPYEAIPGWLENWKKAHPQPADVNQGRVVQSDEVEQSKGESSPLPEWKGF